MLNSLRLTLVTLVTWLLVLAVAFAQFGEPAPERYYLLGRLARVPVQVDLHLQPADDTLGEVGGQLFYETTGEIVMVSGTIDQRNRVALQLTSDMGEIIGSVTGSLTTTALEGNYTPIGASVSPINWQIVALYASLRFNQRRIETATHVPQFTTSASILNRHWQQDAFADNLQFAREGQLDVPEYDLFGYWLEDNYDIAYYADDFVSVLRVYHVYGGGAHPNLFYEAYNVGIGQDIVELSLSDVLTSDGVAFVSEYVLDTLAERGASFVLSGDIADLSEDDMSVFVVSPRGLHLHFAPYAVASYAEGTFEVVVPWEMLAEYVFADSPLVRFL